MCFFVAKLMCMLLSVSDKFCPDERRYFYRDTYPTRSFNNTISLKTKDICFLRFAATCWFSELILESWIIERKDVSQKG